MTLSIYFYKFNIAIEIEPDLIEALYDLPSELLQAIADLSFVFGHYSYCVVPEETMEIFQKYQITLDGIESDADRVLVEAQQCKDTTHMQG